MPGRERADPLYIEALLSRSRNLNEIGDLEALVEKLGKSKLVMLGEATHGTHEFYDWRRVISERLMSQHGFRALVVEGDWPSCVEVDSYLQGGEAVDPEAILQDSFRR